MTSFNTNLMLGFSMQHGRFTIRTASESKQQFVLRIEEQNSVITELWKYCSINDAILAVAKQETGYLPWDGLCLDEVPYKVHDITCWDFEELAESHQIEPLSQATGS